MSIQDEWVSLDVVDGIPSEMYEINRKGLIRRSLDKRIIMPEYDIDLNTWRVTVFVNGFPLYLYGPAVAELVFNNEPEKDEGKSVHIFTPKRHISEAKQFTGGPDDALVITEWLSSHDIKALVVLDDEVKVERIMIETSKYEYDPARVGDWIKLDKDGQVDILKDHVFKDRYSRVEEVYHAHV